MPACCNPQRPLPAYRRTPPPASTRVPRRSPATRARAWASASPARIGAPARGRRGHLHRRHPRDRAARCTARWACRPRPTGASRRCRSTPSAPCRAWCRHATADDIPGTNDCGSIIHDDPILLSVKDGGEIRYLGQPVFAVIARHRDAAPPRRRADRTRADHRGAAAGAHAAGRACARPVRGAADAHRAQRRCRQRRRRGRGARRHRGSAAPPRGHARRRRAGAVLPRGPDQLRHSEGAAALHPLLDPASERDAASGRACDAPAVERGACRVPAHGRRLRRQGIAVGAVRLRGRGGREQAAPPGQAAAGPRRRLHGHGPAPLLLVRRTRWATTTRAACSAPRSHGLARRPLGRPVEPGDDARAVPLRQRLLAAQRQHARLLAARPTRRGQHGLPRLRRPAGR